MEKTIRGSLGAASAFQLTKDMEALDKQSRKILQYREVLAVILKETVEEYQEYSEEEIMAFIEADSIAEETHMTGLGQSIYEEGIIRGIKEERFNAIERMIRAGVTKEQIVSFGYGEEFAEAESMMCQKV